MNEGFNFNNELDFRIIKDDTNMWFRDCDTEWRRQELDEQISRNMLNNRLSKQIISKDDINSMDGFVIMSTGISLIKNNG